MMPFGQTLPLFVPGPMAGLGRATMWLMMRIPPSDRPCRPVWPWIFLKVTWRLAMRNLLLWPVVATPFWTWGRMG